MLEASGGARRVADAAELASVVQELIEHAGKRDSMAQAGVAVARAQGGATERTIDALYRYLGLGHASQKS